MYEKKYYAAGTGKAKNRFEFMLDARRGAVFGLRM